MKPGISSSNPRKYNCAQVYVPTYRAAIYLSTAPGYSSSLPHIGHFWPKHTVNIDNRRAAILQNDSLLDLIIIIVLACAVLYCS
jgi:hypothetical protein